MGGRRGKKKERERERGRMKGYAIHVMYIIRREKEDRRDRDRKGAK